VITDRQTILSTGCQPIGIAAWGYGYGYVVGEVKNTDFNNSQLLDDVQKDEQAHGFYVLVGCPTVAYQCTACDDRLGRCSKPGITGVPSDYGQRRRHPTRLVGGRVLNDMKCYQLEHVDAGQGFGNTFSPVTAGIAS